MGSLEISVRPKIESTEYDIASSGTESEDEVAADLMVETKVKSKDLDLNPISSESDSCSDSDDESLKKNGRSASPAVDLEQDEDGPPSANKYIPTTHELPPTAVPIPSLPDPAALPQGFLELVGEISTVLLDSVIVRGGGLVTAQQRRDAVLDEGSLLLFEDRTPLGYVWETFGPTTLPHYIIRVQRVKETTSQTVDDVSDPVLTAPKDSSTYAGPDPSKLTVSQPVYHLPSLSHFVFPSALANIKGSDASNLHDEEPADHELEFSDDEAEVAHKRLRKHGSSRAPSLAPSACHFGNEEGDAMSVIGDDAHSLYGVSPYDFEDVSTHDPHNITPPTSTTHNTLDPTASPMSFPNTAIRDALMNARNSRNRRSECGQTTTRSRGVRGRRRGAANGPGSGEQREVHQGQNHEHSSFSFEEYDPHMPRPPSPTSIAIARATGQWADGTPFPYDSNNGGYESQGPMYNSSYGAQAFEHQQVQSSPYGIAPHINPRFAHAFGLYVPLAGAQDGPMAHEPKDEDPGPPV